MSRSVFALNASDDILRRCHSLRVFFAFCYLGRVGIHVCRLRSRNVTVDTGKMSATPVGFQSCRIDLKVYPEALPHPSMAALR
jgi:hypothetical protein